ncbi:MAG: hypothetical protein R6U43_00185 [Candidatus Krumholzibacteriales bacterium]
MFEAFRNIEADNLYWGAALAALLTVLAFTVYRRTYPEISRARRLILSGARTFLFICLIIFLINPVINFSRRKALEPVIPVLIDKSGSMDIEGGSGRSRKAIADSILVLIRETVPGRFQGRVETIPFAGALITDDMADTDMSGTDIEGAVGEVISRYRFENLPCIFLISDGADTGANESAAKLDIPVYSVCVGETLRGGDITIEDIIHSERVFSGMDSRIDVIATSSGLEGGWLEAGLYEEGKGIDSARTEAYSGSREYRFSLNYNSEEPGEHILEVRLRYGGNEVSGTGREKFSLKVMEETSRILYIDEFPDWNTTFLRDLAVSMERYSFDFITRNPSRGYLKLNDYSGWRFPDSTGRLDRYRLVMISDAPVIFSDPSRVRILKEYVKGGGSVLLMADLNSPLISMSSYRPLSDFLPVRTVSEPELLSGNFFFGISREAGNPVAVAMAETGTAGRIPPLPSVISGYKETMSAEVPLYITGRKNERITPMFAISEYGEGSAGVLNGIGLWRWRLSGEDGRTAYNTLFSSLIQHMAGGKESGKLRIESSRKSYSFGETPRINVRSSRGALMDGIKGRLYDRDGKLIRTFLFNPRFDEEGIYSAEIPSLQPGYYRVTGREILESGGGMAGETWFSVDSLSVEFVRKSADPGFLRELSERSGGKLTTADKIDEVIAENISKDKVYREDARTVSIRTSTLLLMLILASAVLEWVLRKAWGLV